VETAEGLGHQAKFRGEEDRGWLKRRAEVVAGSLARSLVEVAIPHTKRARHQLNYSRRHLEAALAHSGRPVSYLLFEFVSN